MSEALLDSYRDMILRIFPELEDAAFAALPPGGHSDAMEAGPWVFKFPRNEEARLALEKEARILAIVRPGLTLSVPEMTLYREPRLFSRHRKIPGGHLLAETYATLNEGERQRIAEKLGRFYFELHQVEHGALRAAGVESIKPWRVLGEHARALPLHPSPAVAKAALTALGEFAALPEDPLGGIYGFFDGHGWNMAFDPAARSLNGIYDFADSGFGPLHREFTYSNFISRDLTLRIVSEYERLSGLRLDRRRLDLLTTFHRIDEFAGALSHPEERARAALFLETWIAGLPSSY